MKIFRTLSLSLLAITALFAVSCEKVIDVDLNEEDPKVVIEAKFNAGETTHRVQITRTLNFDEAGPYPTVDNATVAVTDNLGNAAVLTFVGNGFYEVTGYPVLEGRTYTLTVVVEGNTYTASSTVPTQVAIDTLAVLPIVFGPDTLNALLPLRLDPAGVRNFYQFDLYDNNERVEGIYLQDDQFTDGIVVEQPIFGGDYESGDTALVDMYCIDEPVYNYFFALSQNETATPANPTSNFSGGCLGYFSARTKGSASVIIP
jgi:hypothetical protein